REGLALLLTREASVKVAGAAGESDAGNQIAELQPNIVLLDATLEHLSSCVRQVREAAKGVKVVAFAMGEVDQELIACAEAGISAFVGREGSPEDLLRAIAEVRKGEFSASPRQASLLLTRIAELAEKRLDEIGPPNLTRREREILPLI